MLRLYCFSRDIGIEIIRFYLMQILNKDEVNFTTKENKGKSSSNMNIYSGDINSVTIILHGNKKQYVLTNNTVFTKVLQSSYTQVMWKGSCVQRHNLPELHHAPIYTGLLQSPWSPAKPWGFVHTFPFLADLANDQFS